jgi:hypothetical protein
VYEIRISKRGRSIGRRKHNLISKTIALVDNPCYVFVMLGLDLLDLLPLPFMDAGGNE